ncbi:M20/M25/M40 family metallo-hydrolase [bacterium]|nr:M20/M25/M40 family metallo-hydrolase [bacterium]
MENNEEIIKSTIELVKIDSRSSAHAEDSIIDFISKMLSGLKISFEVIQHENYRKSLIALFAGENSSMNLLACGHLDTINLSTAKIDENKNINIEIKDGKIFGLGSSDMKSGIISILFSLKYLVENNIKPKYDIVMALTGDEEADKTGALHLLKNELVKKTRLMIIAEPTNLNLGLGQKGQIWLEIKFKGKQAHGSSPDKGKNAILMAMNFIEEILNPEFFAKNNKFFTKSTINIGFINAPGPFNVVQDNCNVGFDIRISPPETVQEIVGKINFMLNKEFKKSEYELKIIDSLNSSFINPESKAAKQIKSIVDRYASGRRKIALPYATDGSVLNTNLNTPVIILGPGTPEVIHSKDEYVVIDNIIKSVDIYRDIFLNLDKII